jgi:hypothetical protein
MMPSRIGVLLNIRLIKVSPPYHLVCVHGSCGRHAAAR